MRRYILIEHDPAKTVDNVRNYDLFSHLVNLLDDAEIRAKVTEFTTLRGLRDRVRRMK